MNEEAKAAGERLKRAIIYFCADPTPETGKAAHEAIDEVLRLLGIEATR